MGTKLPPAELALYRACDEVLHYVWDPIGISEYPEARDEYHAYLPESYRLVSEGAAERDIAAYLHRIETDRMGLPGDAARVKRVASTLVAWRAHASKQGS